MAQDVGGMVGDALGGLLRGRKRDEAQTAPSSGAPVPVTAVPSPDGNTVYQASGTALGKAATLSVTQSGDVTVAFDKDGNGTKETVVRSSHGTLSVQNTENTRGAITINDKPLADALAAGGYSAIPTANARKIPKAVAQTDLDGLVAEAMVAAGEVPAPAPTPAAQPAAKPKGRH